MKIFGKRTLDSRRRRADALGFTLPQSVVGMEGVS